MRTLLLLVATMGGLSMTATDEADAQEKKEEAKIVTVRFWATNDKHFLDPVPNIKARWYTTEDGKTTDKNGNILISLSKWDDAATGPKTEITFPDGMVYVVVGKTIPIGTSSKIVPVQKKP